MTFEEALIEHCSPTLAGVKPASLFRFCPRDSAPFARRFLALRQQFAARGLRLVILKGCRRTGSYLLYLYRERDLAEVLGRREHRDFCGCWKCYGDPQAARRRFERYRRCTAVLRRRYAEGTPITQLIEAA